MRQLDDTDCKILRILQQDARQELSVIARQVFRSPSSVGERIRKLQEEGIIKRYIAIIDPKKIGQHLLAVTHVSLSVHTKETLNEFQRIAEGLPEVQLCLHLSGACDFILHIAVADTQTYYQVLMEKICSHAYVSHVDTSFVLNECKTHAPYIVDEHIAKQE